MAAGGGEQHLPVFTACLEVFQIAQAHGAPEGEEFPGLDWQGWEEVATALDIAGTDAPVFRARQAVKIAVAADAANLSGERVKFGAVEQRLVDILSGRASLSQVPDTQAEDALLRPPRARVVLRDRRRRPGRSNKADIFYQVLFDGHPEEDGAWLSQGQLRKHFPETWQSLIEEFNQRAKSGTLLEPSPADAGEDAAAAAAAAQHGGQAAPVQQQWGMQAAALSGKRLSTGARPLVPPAAVAELPVLPRNIPLESQPDDQPALYGSSRQPPPSLLLAGVKLEAQQPAPRPAQQLGPRPPQGQNMRVLPGQPAAAAALWAGQQGPILPLTCTGPPPRLPGSFGPPPQLPQRAQQQWQPPQAQQQQQQQQQQQAQQQWQQRQPWQQPQQASSSMAPQSSGQLSGRNLLARAFQRQPAVDSGAALRVPPPQPPPGYGARVPPPMPPPGYPAGSGHVRVPPPLPPPGFQQPTITPAGSPLRSPQRQRGSPLIAAAHAARGGYVFAEQRLSASPAAAASVRSGGASILDAYRRKRAAQSTASPARPQHRPGPGGSPAGVQAEQAEQPRARVPPPLPPPGWVSHQQPLSPEQQRRVPPPLPPAGRPVQQQPPAGQAGGRVPPPLPPPGWQPAAQPAFVQGAVAPVQQQAWQQGQGAGERISGAARRPRPDEPSAAASGGSAEARQPAAKRARRGAAPAAGTSGAAPAESSGNAVAAAPPQQGVQSPLRQAGAVAVPHLAAAQAQHAEAVPQVQPAAGWEEPPDAGDLAFQQGLFILAGLGGTKAPSPSKLDPQGQLMSPAAAAAAMALAAEMAAAGAAAVRAAPPAAAGARQAATGAAAAAAAMVEDTPAEDEFFDAREELAEGASQLQGGEPGDASAQQQQQQAPAAAAAAAGGGEAADGGGLPAAVLDLRTQPDEIQWTNLHDEPADSLPATQVVQGAASSGRQENVVIVPETEDQAVTAATTAQQQQPQQQSVAAAAAAAADEAVAAAEQAQARQQRQLAREQRRQAREQAQQGQQAEQQGGALPRPRDNEEEEIKIEAAAGDDEDSRAEAALLQFAEHLREAEIRGAKSTAEGVELFYEWPNGVQEVYLSNKLLAMAQEGRADPVRRELAKVAQFYESKTRRSKDSQRKRGGGR